MADSKQQDIDAIQARVRGDTASLTARYGTLTSGDNAGILARYGAQLAMAGAGTMPRTA
jgi:hypothetical protein